MLLYTFATVLLLDRKELTHSQVNASVKMLFLQPLEGSQITFIQN